jgi:biopolymer transport protein ExbD
VTLNNDQYGDVTDTEKLTNKLREIFKDREANGAFREGTNEVEKTLFVKSPKLIKYGDVVKVIDACKIAGADPIGLQIDDLD